MSILISAALASSLSLNSGKAPDRIVYFPEGSHEITATVDGEPKTITVKVPPDRGAEIAASLQTLLDERNKSNVRPWFDFEHKRGVASALPKSFSYEPGKGVMCSVEWTGSGRTAIEAKDFSYFSPEFYLGDDGIPDGLPTRGPLGGLVNEPAFREIPRIAASDAAQEPNQPSAMSKLIFAALAISAAAENAEPEAVKAIEKLKSDHQSVSAANATLEAENKGLKAKVEAAEAEAKKTRKERADTLVKAALADGRIAPKDDEKATKFRDKIEAGDTFAEEILAQLPKLNQGMDKTIVLAADGKPVTTGSFEAKASALVTAGQAKSLDEAFGIVAASDPVAYSDYLKTISA